MNPLVLLAVAGGVFTVGTLVVRAVRRGEFRPEYEKDPWSVPVLGFGDTSIGWGQWYQLEDAPRVGGVSWQWIEQPAGARLEVRSALTSGTGRVWVRAMGSGQGSLRLVFTNDAEETTGEKLLNVGGA